MAGRPSERRSPRLGGLGVSGLVGLAGLAAAVAATRLVSGATAVAETVEIKVLSGDPALVTGGDALIQVTVPAGVPVQTTRVTIGTHDVTDAFRPSATPQTVLGVVTVLANGRNTLTVGTKPGGKPGASLEITNYPITGPVFSGPWLQPFICQTEAFTLPDGTKLGAPLDANCSARTVVQYVYRSTRSGAAGAPRPAQGAAGGQPAFKPLPSLTTLPADVAKTTTIHGRDRQLHRPRRDGHDESRHLSERDPARSDDRSARPRRCTPPKGWNRRLIAVHGSGCPGGWYIQGAAHGREPARRDAARRGLRALHQHAEPSRPTAATRSSPAKRR